MGLIKNLNPAANETLLMVIKLGNNKAMLSLGMRKAKTENLDIFTLISIILAIAMNMLGVFFRWTVKFLYLDPL